MSAQALPEEAYSDERHLLAGLRSGEEAAFAALVDRHHYGLVRLAMAYVSDRSVAEEVVQETWIGVMEGLNRFEGRSSLKTWIFRILTNKAKTRGVRESRHSSFSPLGGSDDGGDEPTEDPMRFRQTGYWSEYWTSYPQPWDENTPEQLALSKEGATVLEQAIESLPPKLKQVLVMRDVEGISSEDACNVLGISETNQRVLLHRARSRVRKTLAQYLEGGITAA